MSESRSWVDADRAALWLDDWAAGWAVKKSDDTIRCRRSASLFTADSMDSIRNFTQGPERGQRHVSLLIVHQASSTPSHKLF